MIAFLFLFLLPVTSHAKDEVHKVGPCVFTFKNVVKTELFPEVDAMLIRGPDGKTRTAEDSVDIRHLMGHPYAPAKNTSAILLNEEEGAIFGFYYIDAACKITRSNDFKPHLHWCDSKLWPEFNVKNELWFRKLCDAETMKKHFDLLIRADGTYKLLPLKN